MLCIKDKNARYEKYKVHQEEWLRVVVVVATPLYCAERIHIHSMQSALQMPFEVVFGHELVVTSVKGTAVFPFFVIGVVESSQ